MPQNQQTTEIMKTRPHQLLAVLSIDGCLLDMTPESHWALMAALYSLPEYDELAKAGHPSQRKPSSQDAAWNDYPTIEANRNNITQITKMLQEGTIRRMTIYTIPILAGNGYRLFSEIDTPALWHLVSHTFTDSSNISRVVYEAVEIDGDSEGCCPNKEILTRGL